MTTGEFVRRVVIVMALVVTIALFWLLRDVLIAAFFAEIVAVGMIIPERWLENRGLSANWSLAISITLVTLSVIVLAVLIIPTIVVPLGELVAKAAVFLETLADEYHEARSADLFAAVFPDVEASPAVARLSEALQAARTEQTVQSWFMSTLALPVLQGLSIVVGKIFNFGLLWLIGLWFAVDPASHIQASLYLVPRHRQVASSTSG